MVLAGDAKIGALHRKKGNGNGSIKVKGMFLYSASVGPLKPLYTSPPGRPVHSDTKSTSLGSILAMQQLRAKTNHSHFHHRLYSLIISSTAVYVARYSFLQLSRDCREQKYTNFETVAKGHSNPGSLDCESDILALISREKAGRKA